MAGKSDYFESDVLALVFCAKTIGNLADNAAASPATDVYYALHSADPTDAGTQGSNEATYASYARATVARTTVGHLVTTGTTGIVSPAANVDFPQCTGSSQDETHFSVGTNVAAYMTYSGTVTPNISALNGVTPRLTTASYVTED
jgi:hypothetical protein